MQKPTTTPIRYISAREDGFLPEHLIAGIATRRGGVSKAPYESLNLGKSTEDDAKNVLENRRLLGIDLGIDVGQWAISGQVHGCDIRQVTEPGFEPAFDGMTTDNRGVLLAVSVADCVPVLLFDAETKSCAALHAGWRGTVDDIVRLGVEQLATRFGAKPNNIVAWIGPCICEKTFEVHNDVAQHFDASCKIRVPERPEKWLINLKKANQLQVLGAGLLEQNIIISKRSTVLEPELFFSHRLEGPRTGRMMAFIGWT
jgi:polyphenol oxidase